MAFGKDLLTLVVFTLMAPMISVAQSVAFESLDTVPVYRSIESALADADKVIRLDLSKQKLGEFPEAIFSFKNLQELKLNKCRIAALPDSFDQLPALQKIEIQHNELEVIPPSIFKLKDLRVLDLADNIIDSIPDEIDRLTALTTLALWDNPIAYYPERLTEMQQLRVIDLLNNAMSRETQERLKSDLPQCKIIMSPPCACMDGDE